MSKERPVLFSGPMVRAILEGRKTQTRRVMKLPESLPPVVGREPNGSAWKGVGKSPEVEQQFISTWPMSVRCPHGTVGDLLWIREEHYRFGHWEPVTGVKTKTGRMKWRFAADSDEVLFIPPNTFRKGRHHKDPSTPAWHKRLARFMPHWASRLTLEITGVRVERLQEISEADVIAEGVEVFSFMKGYYTDGLCKNASQECFRRLWDTIHPSEAFTESPESWAANPWVWVIEFKRIDGAAESTGATSL